MLNNPENINNKLEISNVEQLFPAIEWFTDQISSGFFIYKADGDNELIFVNRGLLQIYACETLEEFKELTGFTFKGIVYNIHGIVAHIDGSTILCMVICEA